MRIAVVFDTPYDGWHYEDHARQMAKEVAAWKDDEPEMEYQIADALRERGHEVTLIGVQATICEYLVRCLDELHPELVFNAAEAFHGNAGLEYMVPGHAGGRGLPLHRLPAAGPAGVPQQGDEQEGARLARDPGAALRDLAARVRRGRAAGGAAASR